MALLDKSKFESQDETATAADAPATTEPATAVTVKPSSVPTTVVNAADVFAGFRDALRVDYNTLSPIKLTNGNFVERETNATLGDTIVFDLLSFQDSYTISPNEDKAPMETLKFSDDGITCKDGTLVADHIAYLKEQGYDKAAAKHRMVVVGAVKSASKTDKLNDSLVQFDLSPETRVLFDRFRATTGYLVSKGRLTSEQASKVKGVCRLVTKGTNTYTVADFTVAT